MNGGTKTRLLYWACRTIFIFTIDECDDGLKVVSFHTFDDPSEGQYLSYGSSVWTEAILVYSEFDVYYTPYSVEYQSIVYLGYDADQADPPVVVGGFQRLLIGFYQWNQCGRTKWCWCCTLFKDVIVNRWNQWHSLWENSILEDKNAAINDYCG